MDQKSLNSLDDLRVTTQKLLDQQKLSAARLVSVRRNITTARLISFDYYGNSDKANEIIDINGDINVSYLEGDLEVLTG